MLLTDFFFHVFPQKLFLIFGKILLLTKYQPITDDSEGIYNMQYQFENEHAYYTSHGKQWFNICDK